MNRKVFAIFDAKANYFLPPFVMPNAAVAARWFKGLVNTPDHDFCRFAEDFTLFEFGDFVEDTGKFDLYDGPRSVVIGLMIKEKGE